MISISVIFPFANVKVRALDSLPLAPMTRPTAPFTSAGWTTRAMCPYSGRSLRPDRRAARLGGLAVAEVRADDEIRIEHGKKSFEVAGAQRCQERVNDLALP